MKPSWTKFLPRWEVLAFLAIALFPAFCALVRSVFPVQSTWGNLFGSKLTDLLIYAILALGLNVAVGYTGLLQLGIAAFFGIGVYITGILTVNSYPFQVGFFVSLLSATLGAALFGLILGAPTLRLRGDYLAIVTLGFGEVVKVTLRNLEEITKGTKGLNPIPPPHLPDWLAVVAGWFGFSNKWDLDYRLFFYLSLFILAIVVLLLKNLEHSKLGRSWVAIREDELAASCMGVNVPRAKLAAFAVSAGLAGLAGCLYATKLTNTADPNAYDFNRSIIMLCCIILGGLASIRGTLLGVFLLLGFEYIVSPQIDSWIQDSGILDSAVQWAKSVSPDSNQLANAFARLLTFSNWKFMIFGLALVLMMRFRPEGLLPSSRIQQELRH
ncbi:MAG: branched-chain amino acid ABC transporter permease [Pirellulales bacterium]|nr:branched-chain amino acid ABC transporter permease [Pirellulales bacterium]